MTGSSIRLYYLSLKFSEVRSKEIKIQRGNSILYESLEIKLFHMLFVC